MFTCKSVRNLLEDGANTAPQKMSNFQFSKRANWPWCDKILGAPQRGQKITVNRSKHILVMVSIKLARVLGKIVFHTTLRGRFLLRQLLNIVLV